MTDLFLDVKYKGRTVRSHAKVYNECGEKTLVALHGIGSTAERTFGELSGYLNKDYRLVALDWIGSGKTDRPLGFEDIYGSKYCSDWLELFMEKAREQGFVEDNFSFLGVSMAGLGIAETYSNLKNNIEKIALVNPAGLDRKISKKFAFALSSGLLTKGVASMIVNNEFMWKQILRWDDSKRERLKDDLDNGGEEYQAMLRHGKTGFTPFGRMRDSHFMPEKYSQIDCSVLLIHGKKDEVFYERGYLDFARKQNWKMVELNVEDHSIATKFPEKIAGPLNEFLST